MENPYLPHLAVIKEIKEETHDTKRFWLQFKEERVEKEFKYDSGQFLELSVFGYGEVPISITSSPTDRGFLELCVRRAGKVTSALHQLKKGDIVGIRGPYGNNFPFEETKEKNLLFVAGGLGLVPLRSLIRKVLAERNFFGRISILYGTRTIKDLLFTEELKAWSKIKGVEVLVTLDVGDKNWKGKVGVVTTLFKEAQISPSNTVAVVCGPTVMFRFAILDLLKMGFAEEDIISTLERHMKCGIGKCGHCNIGEKYVCMDGPVFTYKEMRGLPRVFD